MPKLWGELTAEGFCHYCNTKVRYANELIVDLSDILSAHSEIEMMIKVKRGDELIFIPFKGYLEQFHEDFSEPIDLYADNTFVCAIRDTKPRLSITFSGYVQDNPVL